MATDDIKPEHKATIKLAAYSQDRIDRIIENLQAFVISEGFFIEGKITYEVPLSYRERIAGPTQLTLITTTTDRDRSA